MTGNGTASFFFPRYCPTIEKRAGSLLGSLYLLLITAILLITAVPTPDYSNSYATDAKKSGRIVSSTVDDLTVQETLFATSLWSVRYQDASQLRARTFLVFSFHLFRLFFHYQWIV